MTEDGTTYECDMAENGCHTAIVSYVYASGLTIDQTKWVYDSSAVGDFDIYNAQPKSWNRKADRADIPHPPQSI